MSNKAISVCVNMQALKADNIKDLASLRKVFDYDIGAENYVTLRRQHHIVLPKPFSPYALQWPTGWLHRTFERDVGFKRVVIRNMDLAERIKLRWGHYMATLCDNGPDWTEEFCNFDQYKVKNEWSIQRRP